MPSLKVNVISILRAGAEALLENGERDRAYACHEAINNLLLVMRGSASLNEWNSVYAGGDSDQIDLETHIPD